MESNVQRKGLVNWVTLLLVGGVNGLVAAYAHSLTGLVATVFMGLGVLVALTAYLQMRVEERERLETLEFAELSKKSRDSSLFAEQAVDTFPAKQARIQFEKYFVPGMAVLLAVLQGLGAWLLWTRLGEDTPFDTQRSTVAMVVFGIAFLVFFQMGKYAAVYARLEGLRLLRPQASYLLLGALLSAVVVGLEIAGWAGHPEWDLSGARVLTVLLGLVAVENVVTLVFEIYRPRLRGQEAHPLYESRLIGILSQPGGLIRTAAQALDYQFGFKVSETWFYRFLEQALAWLILLQVGVFLLSSTVVVIHVGQKGLLERFGRLVPGGVLEPGWHLKLPWPLSKVYRFDTERVQTFTLGFVPREENGEEERTVLWTRAHAKEEFNMLVASRDQSESGEEADRQAVPVNLLAVRIPVHFKIRDLEKYAYHAVDTAKLLENLANQELTRYLVSVDLNDVMGPGRRQAAEELERRIQARADAHDLGVRILFVGLAGIHPPIQVASDFEAVMGAMQAAEATNHLARAYAAEQLPAARAEATRMVDEAEAERVRRVALATAAAGQFTNQVAAWRASPETYRHLVLLESLSRALANPRKYIVAATNAHEVITLNLEDKIRPDLTDIMLPSEEKQ